MVVFGKIMSTWQCSVVSLVFWTLSGLGQIWRLRPRKNPLDQATPSCLERAEKEGAKQALYCPSLGLRVWLHPCLKDTASLRQAPESFSSEAAGRSTPMLTYGAMFVPIPSTLNKLFALAVPLSSQSPKVSEYHRGSWPPRPHLLPGG